MRALKRWCLSPVLGRAADDASKSPVLYRVTCHWLGTSAAQGPCAPPAVNGCWRTGQLIVLARTAARAAIANRFVLLAKAAPRCADHATAPPAPPVARRTLGSHRAAWQQFHQDRRIPACSGSIFDDSSRGCLVEKGIPRDVTSALVRLRRPAQTNHRQGQPFGDLLRRLFPVSSSSQCRLQGARKAS